MAWALENDLRGAELLSGMSGRQTDNEAMVSITSSHNARERQSEVGRWRGLDNKIWGTG